MKFVFWEDALSIIQSAFIRSLAALPNNHVTVVVARQMYEERLKLGWTVPDLGQTEIIVAPSALEMQKLVKSNVSDSAHIFYGINADKMILQAFQLAVQERSLLGLMSERSYGYPSIKKPLLRIRDYLQVKSFPRGLDFFLAIGTWAVKWYASAGYPLSILYPFAYFVEPPNLIEHDIAKNSFSKAPGAFQIVYIGQGIRRKGVDVLLKALAKIRDHNWEFHMVGNGSKDTYQNLCSKLEIASKVRFHGVLNNEAARQLLNYADLLVLPSRYDGWGAVVNEALMHGVPVICSDQCGAKDLLGEEWRGNIFPAGSVSVLSQLLESQITRGKLTQQERSRIMNWSQCITGEQAARYLLEIIEHVQGQRADRPQAPWLN